MLVSCSNVPQPEPPNAKTTVPLSGDVFVDGEFGWGVRVTLNPVGGIDPANPTMSVGEADNTGHFEIGTYGINDGAPPGEYIVTLQQFDRSQIRIGGGKPPDLFKGKYADPRSSEFTVSVPESAPEEGIYIGPYELESAK